MKLNLKRWNMVLIAGIALSSAFFCSPSMAENHTPSKDSCYVHPSIPPIRGYYPYSYYGLKQQKKGHSYEDWEKMYKAYTEETERYMKLSQEYDQEVKAYIDKIRVYGLRVPCDVDAAAQIQNAERFINLPEDSDGFVAEWFNPFPKLAKEPKLARYRLTAADFRPPTPPLKTCTVDAGVPPIQGYYPHQPKYQPEWLRTGYTQAQWEQDRKAYKAEIHRYHRLYKTYNRLTQDYLRKVRVYQGQVPCEVEAKFGVKPTLGKDFWAIPEDSDGYISERFNGFPKPVEE